MGGADVEGAKPDCWLPKGDGAGVFCPKEAPNGDCLAGMDDPKAEPPAPPLFESPPQFEDEKGLAPAVELFSISVASRLVSWPTADAAGANPCVCSIV